MTDTQTRPATETFDSAEHQARLKELYRDFEAAGLTPLWLTREGLMPFHPQPRAVPHLWRWAELLPLAARSAELVPVGRGGERRAISLGNPGRADPNVPRGATEITVGRYRAWLAPRGYLPAGDGAAILVQGGAAEGRDLMIGASGLSRPALVSLVSVGLSAA